MKLPVFATVADAWRELIHDWRIFVRLSAIPVAIQVVGTALLALGAPEPGPDAVGIDPGAVLRALLYSIALWLLLVPAITAWHRHVLLGPGERPAHPGYHLGLPEWRYVKKSILVAVAGTLIAIAIGTPLMILAAVVGGGMAGERDVIGAPVAIAIPVLVFLVLIDWALVFPAAALDRSLALGEARRLGRGNRLRLAAVLVLAYLPQVILSHLVGAIVVAVLGDALASPVGRTIALLAQMLTQYAFLAVTVGALSFSWLKLSARAD